MTDAGKPASKFQKFRLQKNTANTIHLAALHSPSIHTFHHTSIHLFTHPSKLRSHLNTLYIYMMWFKKFKNHQLSGKQGVWNNFWKHLHHPFQTRSSWDLVLPLGDHTVSPIKSTGAVAKISSAKRPHVERSSTAMWFAGQEMLPSYHSTNISWQYPAFPRWNEIYEVMTLWWLFFPKPFGWRKSEFYPHAPGNNIAIRCPNGHIEGKKNVECENHILSKRQRSWFFSTRKTWQYHDSKTVRIHVEPGKPGAEVSKGKRTI